MNGLNGFFIPNQVASGKGLGRVHAGPEGARALAWC